MQEIVSNQEGGEGQAPSFQPRPAQAPRKLAWVIVIIVLLAIAGLAWAIWGRGDSGPVAGAASSTPVSAADQAKIEKETKDLLALVGRHILLPDEPPTVATILDAKKLVAEQAFYAGAENGDKLIIYPQARKAIIFSASRDRVVNAGPVFFEDNPAGTGTAKPAAAPKAPAKSATTTR